MAGLFEDAEVIHTYTRAQAIEDGVLVDVTETAREAGFTYPVALTADAWAEAVAWDSKNAGLQDEAGRLWDVAWMAASWARVAKRPGTYAHAHASRLTFQVMRVPNTPRARTARLCDLVMVVGPGDAGEPVITIMCANED